MSNNCKRFAEALARQKGMSYKEATKKYPRGPYKNSCYYNDCQTVEGHCVHCARAEAIGKNMR